MITRIGMRLQLFVLMLVTVIGLNGQKLSSAPIDSDLSKQVVDSMLTRIPDSKALGPWEYSRALYLFGMFSVYERTHDPRYLAYIKQWADSHIDAEGNIDRPIDALDFVLPGNVALALYEQTGEQKYRLAAEKLRKVFETYPRTSDGGFWHAEIPSRQHQLWLDGTYMSMPFLVRCGRLFGDEKAANKEAVRQLVIYNKHLRAASGGLFLHAYDETGTAPWANPETHQASVKWARAIGWYGMALVDVLDAIPQNQPGRGELIQIVRDMVRDLSLYQDHSTGLWYQVVDQPKLAGNWPETSSSSMFSYMIDIAVKRGYVDKKYKINADRGYKGVMSAVSLDADGLTNISGICEGTNVGDLNSYLARKRNINDFHGLGAFLLMNEEHQFNISAMQITHTR